MFTGSQLLVKGALESPLGVHVFTGHASALAAPYFAQLARVAPLLDSRKLAVQPAANDALALASAMAVVRSGQRVISVHSTQGLASAADAFCDLASRPMPGESGALIIIIDDHWGIASRPVAADPRFLAQQARVPLLEPASPQELKDMIRLGLELSCSAHHPIAVAVPAELFHGGGSVVCHPHPPVSAAVGDPGFVGVSGAALERLIEQRLAAARHEARRLAVNQLQYRPVKGEVAPLGFIAVGQAAANLSYALAEVDLLGRLPMLKLAMSFPLDEAMVLELAKCSAQIIVLEERRPFVEKLVAEIFFQNHQQNGGPLPSIWGKHFPKPHAGLPTNAPLHPSLLLDRLEPLLRELSDLPADLVHPEHSPLAVESRRIRALLPLGRVSPESLSVAPQSRMPFVSLPIFSPPVRAATFCPGCPHRDVASVLHELRRDLLDPQYMLERHKRQSLTLKVHADAGCASLLANDPHGLLVHSVSAAGLSTAAVGAGAPDTRNLVLLGDGALFQSGLAAISESLASGRDLTIVVLDNHVAGAAAQLSHAGSPLVNSSLLARKKGDPAAEERPESAPQDIERILAAMIPKPLAKLLHVVRIDPADRARFRKLVEQSLLSAGLQVVVADKECGVSFHKRQHDTRQQETHERGFVARQTFMNIATEVCENCLECTVKTGCTALAIVPTDHGPKIQTDLTSCVNDGACQRIDACPSFESVIVTRTRPAARPDWVTDDSALPDPVRIVAPGRDVFRVLVAGIGGQGVSTLADILAHAGHHAGFHTQFVRHHGVAVRTGPVSAQLVFMRNDAGSPDAAPHGKALAVPQIPVGHADLLLALDAVEGLRAVSPDSQAVPPAAPSRTAAVVDISPHATVAALVGRDHAATPGSDEYLRQFTHPERHVSLAISEQAEALLGSAELANTMLLGVAYQSGFLPFDLSELQQAVRAVAPDRIDLNLRALHVGRRLVHDRQLQAAPAISLAATETPRVTLHRKTRSLRQRFPGRRGRRLVKHLRILLRQARREAMRPETLGGPRRLIPDDLWCQVVVRAHDCIVWDGRDYAARYCAHVVSVFRKDSPDFGYAMTRAALDSVARVMLVKDEVYVAAMLTSPEKYEADRRRFNIQPDRGDVIKYVHHNHPEFEVLGKKLRFEWKSRDWELKLMASLRMLRHVLPGWHRREHDFREWFESLLPRVDWTPDQGARAYQKWVTILAMPQQATGYREVRYPKMDLVRRRAMQLLATDAALFEPAVSVAVAPAEPELAESTTS